MKDEDILICLDIPVEGQEPLHITTCLTPKEAEILDRLQQENYPGEMWELVKKARSLAEKEK